MSHWAGLDEQTPPYQLGTPPIVVSVSPAAALKVARRLIREGTRTAMVRRPDAGSLDAAGVMDPESKRVGLASGRATHFQVRRPVSPG